MNKIMIISNYITKFDMKAMIALAIPLMLTGLVESSIGFTSTFFLAHLGPEYLGAGSLVAWSFAALMMIMWGVVMSISVLTSHHYGAQDHHGVALVLRDGIWLALLLIAPTMFLLWNLGTILIWLGQDPAMVILAVPYTHALAWSAFPDFLGLALLQFIIGLGHTRTNLIITLCWVPINIFVSYVLTFGKLGFPNLGIAGLGWGTLISYWFTLILLVIYLPLRKYYRRYFWAFKSFSAPKYLWELFKIGLPIGLMWFVEVLFFLCLALIMGHHSLALLDANQITIQFVAFFVSIVFAIAQAITVRMGHQLGAKQFASANRAVYAGVMLAALMTIVEVLLYWLAPKFLINLDLNPARVENPLIETYAIRLFAVAAFFQLFESVRISLFGALRALKDTRFTLVTSILAFWGIALPFGFIFTEIFKWGPTGFWWAMTIGAFLNVLLLSARYRAKFQAYQQRYSN